MYDSKLPDTTDFELRLGFLFHDVSRLRRRAVDHAFKKLKVTRAQWWVLANLSRQDGMTQTQLAEELDLGKVAIGGLIDRLEKVGLVRRVADPKDRRANRIFLAPKSKLIITRMRDISHKLNGKIHSGISEKQLEVTAATLHTMKHNMLDYLQNSDKKPSAGTRPVGGRESDEPR